DTTNIATVTVLKNGQQVTHQVIEIGVNNTVLILSPDISEDITSSCEMFRTLQSCRESMSLQYSLDVTFTAAEPSWKVGQAPYDPFIFAVGSYYHGEIFAVAPGRQWEVHLKQFSGTSAFNSGFFSMGDDASNGSNSFVTSNNMPWVLNITDDWDHPAEYQDISHAYPDFPKWVASGGFSYTDWYLRSNADTSKLYE
ncbi:MAG: LruC domain-containing protein, partial [Psychrosphaera sp.]|nr:LruC domain-containing protein [Psychrosphaera sp.]